MLLVKLFLKQIIIKELEELNTYLAFGKILLKIKGDTC